MQEPGCTQWGSAGLENNVDQRQQQKLEAEACGIPSGCCGDSFNLSIPHCPQQLLETEGLKTPRAETHKSRLGWNKKEGAIGWGRQGLVFHHRYGISCIS